MNLQMIYIILSVALLCSCEDNPEMVKTEYSGGMPNHIRYNLNDDLEQHLIFYSNGVLSKKFQTNHNGIQGYSISFHENQNVYQVLSFENDTLEGESLIFYDNGQVRDRFFYAKGEKVKYIQYNRDGSRRGEALLLHDNEYFKRVWTYDSLLNVTSLYTGICTFVKVEEEYENDSVRIDFQLPLDNEEYSNEDFSLSFSIKFYEGGKIVDERNELGHRFDNGFYTAYIPIPENIDSLVIFDQVSYADKKHDECRMSVVVDNGNVAH